ncbi:hypothetical protein H112_03611 [Trichophyton rubrum D6]|uniref:Uncharacterized protein n=3 Tax=Trichophyton TaxID=5550 RepID=A0A080WLT9_TRIRC|nr:uncharacterized protein TERG_12213 [Trichophyton rubrum CBS 118892]EZF23768.1 hypothetical protein H100_03617 [Trichophyton rubrum MR850]EZF42784.1 hypothetical protein H102_03610 [Trichophyton rubrum CBS 100081]EZF53451.1 hypothetical protein H103_03620 [Trichophyton rubrum CBS 288.86]EZF64066.1 hypothetical protein H104_03606 [Trichophyton rubrum CBS 289.86]EZF74657.1 hypothetical protein H105_03634 [Trichophyton soudanense CBS 452.61]EZF85358.1 hypothetical protein H110_03619 [Trichophy
MITNAAQPETSTVFASSSSSLLLPSGPSFFSPSFRFLHLNSGFASTRTGFNDDSSDARRRSHMTLGPSGSSLASISDLQAPYASVNSYSLIIIIFIITTTTTTTVDRPRVDQRSGPDLLSLPYSRWKMLGQASWAETPR